MDRGSWLYQPPPPPVVTEQPKSHHYQPPYDKAFPKTLESLAEKVRTKIFNALALLVLFKSYIKMPYQNHLSHF